MHVQIFLRAENAMGNVAGSSNSKDFWTFAVYLNITNELLFLKIKYRKYSSQIIACFIQRVIINQA